MNKSFTALAIVLGVFIGVMLFLAGKASKLGSGGYEAPTKAQYEWMYDYCGSKEEVSSVDSYGNGRIIFYCKDFRKAQVPSDL